MYKKYRLADRKRFFMFLAFCFTMFCFTFMIVNAGAASPESQEYATVRVQKGDTLWEIASVHCDGDVRPYIHQIKQINRLEADTIHEGQLILVP